MVFYLGALLHLGFGALVGWALFNCCGPDEAGGDRYATWLAAPLWLLAAWPIVRAPLGMRWLALAAPFLWLGAMASLLAIGIYSVSH